MQHNKLTKTNPNLLVVLFFALYELLGVFSCFIFTINWVNDPDTFAPNVSTLFLLFLEIAFFALLLYYIANKKIGRQLPVLFAVYSTLYNMILLASELWRCSHDVNAHFSAFYGISVFLSIVCGLFFAAFLELLISKNEKNAKYTVLAKKYWYVSAIVYIIPQVIPKTAVRGSMLLGSIASRILSSVPLALGILILCWYLKDYSDENSAKELTNINEKDYSRNLTTHILLLLFTFGVYFWIWIYKTTEFTNSISNSQYRRNPTTKMLLCMFVPFYYLYWLHYTCKEIEQYSKAKGVPCSISTLCVVLAIFTYFFVSPIIMQSKLNEAIQFAPAFPEEQITAEETPLPKTPDSEKIDALKQYKELLDSGILTQEEFDTKKKQLLGL